MTVAELIAVLQTFPQDTVVNVNNNEGGIFHEEVHSVNFFEEDSMDPARVVIQVNVYE